MKKERDPNKTIKGLIPLIESIKLHYAVGSKSLDITPSDAEQADKIQKEREARRRGLETDLWTLRGALGKILLKVKQKDYQEIQKIIEEEMYENGFDHRYRYRQNLP